MPIYEYECLSCSQRSEVIQRLADDPLTTCSECGGELRKLISAPSFQFKGSGWYVTDYADKSGKGDPGEKGDKGDSEGASSASKAADTSSGSDSSSKDSSKDTSKATSKASSSSDS